MTGSQEPGAALDPVIRRVAAVKRCSAFAERLRHKQEHAQLLRKIAALSLFAALLLAGCGSPPAPKVQISPADIARQAPAPIQISPRVAGIYAGYLEQVAPENSGVFAISPNGNRVEYRFCRHPDCGLSDDEVAERALARCDRGLARKDPDKTCVVFDLNGKVNQPYRTWSESDFDTPNPAPPVLSVKDAAELAPGRFAAMTPDGQMIISLRADGRAYLWDTGDGFHQATWSLKGDNVCVDSIDGRAQVTCGQLYGADKDHIVGATLDMFPGKYLTLTRIGDTTE
jgi:hypothetical protein